MKIAEPAFLDVIPIRFGIADAEPALSCAASALAIRLFDLSRELRSAASAIRFLRRGKVVELSSVPPMRTLLDYLRLEEKSRGTKEGCGEGDCGACTVALGSWGWRVAYEPVNACILCSARSTARKWSRSMIWPTADKLHPVQQAMVDHRLAMRLLHAGFRHEPVHALSFGQEAERQQIVDHLAGNLCRCTGYRPIVDAALQACRAAGRSGGAAARQPRVNFRARDGADVFVGDDQSFFASPASEEHLPGFMPNIPMP